jgi:predicted small secreted protein
MKYKLKTIQSKIFCISVLACLALTACNSAGVGETPIETANSSVSKGSAADSDPKTVIIGSMEALQDAKSWIADVDTSSDTAPQTDTKMRIKYSAPDNFQIEGEAAGIKTQTISVGKDTFIHTDEKWEKLPATVNMGQMVRNLKEMFSPEKFAAFKGIEFAGKETVDGKELSTYTYEIDVEALMPEEVKKQMTDEMKAKLAETRSANKAKIWIDEQKNLPAKIEMTTKMSKPKEMTQKFSVNYKFDEEVKIEAPQLP